MDELTVKLAAAVGAVQTLLDAAAGEPTVDKRSLAVARTQFETAFLWAANAAAAERLFEG